jgi:hypothetical protein
MGTNGDGTARQQQITYRDKNAYATILKSPSFPFNSLMVHGITINETYPWGWWGKTKKSDETQSQYLSRIASQDLQTDVNIGDIRDEIWTYFSQGFNLQELYINPMVFGEAKNKIWNHLSEASSWARVNHEVLKDAHFIGNPGNANIKSASGAYGVASFVGTKGIVMLRNPTASSITFNLDVSRSLELPDSYKNRTFKFKNRLNPTHSEIIYAGTDKPNIIISPYSMILYEVSPQ